MIFLTCGTSSAPLCPRIESPKDFILTRYAGVWYEVYRHDINEISTKRENHTLTINSNVEPKHYRLKSLKKVLRHMRVHTEDIKTTAQDCIRHKLPTRWKSDLV
ncbi:unnamed protein product [Adineta ricciae]|uniref:Uncharacterized protein n=1 Tax=Adineta ricciae TaxID=249248 RepID=A0A815TAQ9_ADIRI|nr:unnamed protein product [Adineta ricciae]